MIWQSVYKMLANLLDLWKFGSKSLTPAKRNILTMKKWKKDEESRTRKFEPTWKENFPGLNLTRRTKQVHVLHCLLQLSNSSQHSKVSLLYVGINGSSCELWEEPLSFQFCLQQAKNEEKLEQASLQRISRKIDKESKENSKECKEQLKLK